MRVVLDANVLVSALLSPQGVTGRLFRRLVEDPETVFLISSETMSELRRTLTYPKIQKRLKLPAVDVERILSSVELLAEEVDESMQPVGLHCRDADDIKYLVVAIVGRADYLVTGDQDLMLQEQAEGIPIISPAEMLKEISS